MMKSRISPLALVALASIVVAGCATTGYQQAEKTRHKMAKSQVELLAGQQQVTDTMTALSQLHQSTGANLVPDYKAFSRELSRLHAIAKKADKRAIASDAASAAYLNSWAETIIAIHNPEVKKQSVARRSVAIANHRKVGEKMHAVTAAYLPLVANLDDIDKYLSEDLTAGGLKSIQPFANKAKIDAKNLNVAISSAVSEVARVSKNLAAMSRP